MKKGVWNVENPLALSELFSEGIFQLPVPKEEILVASNNATDSQLETSVPKEDVSITKNEVSNSKEPVKNDAAFKNEEPVIQPSSFQPIPQPIPNLEKVYIINLIYEETEFNSKELVGNIIKAVKIPGFEMNAQTVKFVNVPKQTAAINNDILLATLNHYPQLRLIFYGLNSTKSTEFHQMKHSKALLLDMPSFMAQSVPQKKLNWEKIQVFFGMK